MNNHYVFALGALGFVSHFLTFVYLLLAFIWIPKSKTVFKLWVFSIAFTKLLHANFNNRKNYDFQCSLSTFYIFINKLNRFFLLFRILIIHRSM